jgi:predicted acyl esterase
LLMSDFDSGATKAAYNLMPPIAQDPEGRWARIWRARLDGNSPWIFDWHGAPPDLDYWWRVRTPVEQIHVPTFVICGWRDLEPGPSFEIYNAVVAPKRVLIGPWKHELADQSPIEPVGALHEMDRWWDRWLKSQTNGVDEEPPITLYVQERAEWRHETEWPPARTHSEEFRLGAGQSLTAGGPSTAPGQDDYQYDPRVGLGSVGYNPHRVHLDLPADQSVDDLASLSYTTAPLLEDVEITGQPVAHIFMSATAGHTNLVAKLCVVGSDNRSRVIAVGHADTTRTSAHQSPVLLERGEVREVIIRLRPTSYQVRAGQRLRLALAGTDFPELWPTTQPYHLTVYFGAANPSRLEVPFMPARAIPLAAPALQPPATDLSAPEVVSSQQTDRVIHDLTSHKVSFECSWVKEFRLDAQTRLVYTHEGVISTDADRPWLSTMVTTTRCELRRPLNHVVTVAKCFLSPFDGHVVGEVYIDGESYYHCAWDKNFLTDHQPAKNSADASAAHHRGR